MQKNSITNKITPCCGLPFSVVYWWVSNLTLNSESDRQYLLTQISQNGVLSIDGWKVLINSGTLEADASLTKAEFLAWFNCGRQPTCEQLKLIIDGFKVGNWTPEIDSLLENYYTKNETHSQTEINGFLSTKLDKGTYVGTAQDLYERFEGKIEADYNGIPKVGNGASGKVLESSVISEIYGKIGIGLPGQASERFEVGGNIKATQIKDQYGTLKSQRTITITGNTTLSETHNGAILNVTNTCNITVPTGLDANFNCVIFAKGSIIVTFVNSGVTIYAPSGLLLKQDKMASLICTSTNNFNLTGELAVS